MLEWRWWRWMEGGGGWRWMEEVVEVDGGWNGWRVEWMEGGGGGGVGGGWRVKVGGGGGG